MNAIRNANGQRISQTVDGVTFNWQYDERGNCTRFEASTGYFSDRVYDKKDRIVSLTDSLGVAIKYKYDRFGNVSYI
jgi:YD repeat-containing protein